LQQTQLVEQLSLSKRLI